MKIIRRAWEVVSEFRRAYLVLNLVYYGLVVVCMVFVALNPAVQAELLKAIGQATSEGGVLAPVASAYRGGQVFGAMALTFVVNLLLGSLLEITVPSLVVPFSGVLMGVYRAVLWGLLLSPAEPQLRGAMIPHSLTLLIEGQAYVVAMLGAYIQAKAFLRPESVGAKGHLAGYVAGLKRTAWLYVLVVLLLAVAAVYEALEVIYLAPLFSSSLSLVGRGLG